MARALREPFRDEHAPPADLAELARRWGSVRPARCCAAPSKLGLLRERDDGGYEFTSARVARVGRGARRASACPPSRRSRRPPRSASTPTAIAELFERIWLEHVWEPFVEAGRPAEQWPEIRAKLEQVQPLAMDAVIGLFQVAMEKQIESGMARDIERAESEPRGT